MANFTQKYRGVVVAPWLSKPEVQFATFTFDDATPSAFPTWASVTEEMFRRSAFKDTDATQTGDVWGTGTYDLPKAIETGKAAILYLEEINPLQDLLGVAPRNIAEKRFTLTTDAVTGEQTQTVSYDPTKYVWPLLGGGQSDVTSEAALEVGAGFSAMTLAGDNVLTGDASDADDTPALVLTGGVASAGTGLGSAGLGLVADVITQAQGAYSPVVESFTLDADGDVSDSLATKSDDVYTVIIQLRNSDGSVRAPRAHHFHWTNTA